MIIKIKIKFNHKRQLDRKLTENGSSPALSTTLSHNLLIYR